MTSLPQKANKLEKYQVLTETLCSRAWSQPSGFLFFILTIKLKSYPSILQEKAVPPAIFLGTFVKFYSISIVLLCFPLWPMVRFSLFISAVCP